LSWLAWPFWNNTEKRFRSLVRLPAQFVLVVLVTLLLQRAGSFSVDLLNRKEVAVSDQLTLVVGYAIILTAVAVSLGLAAWLLDKRSTGDYGFHFSAAWWLDLGFGLVLGAVLMTGVFLVQLAAGWIQVTGTFQAVGDRPFGIAIWIPLFIFLCVGIFEEMLFRGYHLLNLAEGLNLTFIGPRGSLVLAWVLSSVIFGLYHVNNPNATTISTIYLMLVGLFFGLGYILTGQLAISIGIHITWNFVQGSVFGFPVSGTSFSPVTFITIEQGGPALWTGGAFGPEAGLLGIIALIVGCLLVLVWVRVRLGYLKLQISVSQYRWRGHSVGRKIVMPSL
jgi:uncharacterized protein